ncbi:DoxX family protein [Lentibacillus sp. N15]|uniref:DoxX family protein n=1 Tax=Lentibacillus songyuanensis TaxID=3136161 RepID=UPI0031BA4C49
MKNLSLFHCVCYAVGYVFIISGILKLIDSNFRVMFSNLALPFPNSFLFLIAITELVCGTLIIARLYLKHASGALIIIMLGAIFLTKFPILTTDRGLLTFLFEARLEIVMLMLLFPLWFQAPKRI